MHNLSHLGILGPCIAWAVLGLSTVYVIWCHGSIQAKTILRVTSPNLKEAFSEFSSKKVVSIFSMENSSPASVLLSDQLKLSNDKFLSSKFEKEDLLHVSYCNVFCFVMYTMICTKHKSSHSISVLSTYIANPSRPH